MISDAPGSAADLEYQIARLNLGPGDVLVVKIAHTLSADIGGNIRDRFESFLGNKTRVLVIDNSMDLLVVSAEAFQPQPEIKAM